MLFRSGVSAALCPPGSKEATTTLHMLTLLKDLLPCFPDGLVKSCSETLLRVMTLSHVVSSGPSAWGRAEEEGGQSFRPQARGAGTREAHCSGQKRGWDLPAPRAALSYTQGQHCIPDVGQTGHLDRKSVV